MFRARPLHFSIALWPFRPSTWGGLGRTICLTARRDDRRNIGACSRLLPGMHSISRGSMLRCCHCLLLRIVFNCNCWCLCSWLTGAVQIQPGIYLGLRIMIVCKICSRKAIFDGLRKRLPSCSTMTRDVAKCSYIQFVRSTTPVQSVTQKAVIFG